MCESGAGGPEDLASFTYSHETNISQTRPQPKGQHAAAPLSSLLSFLFLLTPSPLHPCPAGLPQCFPHPLRPTETSSWVPLPYRLISHSPLPLCRTPKTREI